MKTWLGSMSNFLLPGGQYKNLRASFGRVGGEEVYVKNSTFSFSTGKCTF